MNDQPKRPLRRGQKVDGGFWVAEEMAALCAAQRVLAEEVESGARAVLVRAGGPLPAAARAELELWTRVEAPNLVRVTGVSPGDGAGDAAWSELVPGDGETLAALLDGGVDLDEAVRVVHQVLCGLEVLHGAGLRHLALHPELVWLCEEHHDHDDHVRLGGAGLGGLVVRTAGRGEAPPPAIAGYLAPEVALGDEPGAAADVYGAGALLHAALTGAPPLRVPADASGETVLEAVVFDSPQPLLLLRPELDARLCDLVHAMLAKDPAQRPGSAQEAREALARWVPATLSTWPGCQAPPPARPRPRVEPRPPSAPAPAPDPWAVPSALSSRRGTGKSAGPEPGARSTPQPGGEANDDAARVTMYLPPIHVDQSDRSTGPRPPSGGSNQPEPPADDDAMQTMVFTRQEPTTRGTPTPANRTKPPQPKAGRPHAERRTRARDHADAPNRPDLRPPARTGDRPDASAGAAGAEPGFTVVMSADDLVEPTKETEPQPESDRPAATNKNQRPKAASTKPSQHTKEPKNPKPTKDQTHENKETPDAPKPDLDPAGMTTITMTIEDLKAMAAETPGEGDDGEQ